MGAESDSRSTSTSQDYSNAFNQTLTQSVGQNGLGIFSTGTNTIGGGLSYLENSGNTTTTDNNSYSLGAGSTAGIAGSGSGTGLGSTLDWSSLLPWIIIGAVGIFVVLGLRKG